LYTQLFKILKEVIIQTKEKQKKTKDRKKKKKGKKDIISSILSFECVKKRKFSVNVIFLSL